MRAHFDEFLTMGNVAVGDRLAVDQQRDLLGARRR
jgi:hypothetical protein